MRFIGRVPIAQLDHGAMVRLADPPFDALVAIVQEVPCAIEDACNHGGASLSEGERRGSCVSCPMHGYVFDLSSGQLVSPRGLCGPQRRLVARREGTDVVVLDPGPPVALLGG